MFDEFFKLQYHELPGETFAEKADNIWKILSSLEPEDCEMHSEILSIIENRFGLGIARRKSFLVHPDETYLFLVFSDCSLAVVFENSSPSLISFTNLDDMFWAIEANEKVIQEIRDYLSIPTRQNE